MEVFLEKYLALYMILRFVLNSVTSFGKSRLLMELLLRHLLA